MIEISRCEEIPFLGLPLFTTPVSFWGPCSQEWNCGEAEWVEEEENTIMLGPRASMFFGVLD